MHSLHYRHPRAFSDMQPPSVPAILQEVDIAMLAAMATFGFAHKSSPPNIPTQQQHHTTALQTYESASPLQVSSALHLSRSLLAGQAAISRASQVDVAAADASLPLSSSLLELGGPVAAAAAVTEGPQPPQPGRAKVSCRVAGTVTVTYWSQLVPATFWKRSVQRCQ